MILGFAAASKDSNLSVKSVLAAGAAGASSSAASAAGEAVVVPGEGAAAKPPRGRSGMESLVCGLAREEVSKGGSWRGEGMEGLDWIGLAREVLKCRRKRKHASKLVSGVEHRNSFRPGSDVWGNC